MKIGEVEISCGRFATITSSHISASCSVMSLFAADGFSLDYIHKIITELKELKYEPRPVRRTYIEKRNGKMRPLGIPSFKDKLIQEIIRSILEAIYEPRKGLPYV